MRLLSHYMVSAGLVAFALGQTPPDTQPATNSSLGISYGSTIVTPGIELPLTGKAPFSTPSPPSPPPRCHNPIS